ncbi:fungal-specific transcription factor domain-containing protein [Mycena maculata]|uniref:Fungal-specific transcription factor domain-containing protein n=1 Tax=Mycena maculata TaxID=230809 RepID=A0AAD7J9T0_9AGAR|nr:fungal-specific transcription factor domain-containing protein [Mycena maculata]
MSEGNEDPVQNVKRKRLRGACDICRKKKVRCDSAEMPGKRCTNCITFKTECTHARLNIEETPPAAESLTGREHVAKILSTSTVYIPSNDPEVSHQILVEVAQYARSLEEQLFAVQGSLPSTTSPQARPSTDGCLILVGADTAEDAFQDASLQDVLPNLISGPWKPARFFGKSSSVHFAKAAINYMHGDAAFVAGLQRPEFWTPQPWENFLGEPPKRSFPEDDLLNTLVKIYFEQINPILGILHSASFYQSLADGRHSSDPHFGAVVLVVCSMASRYSDDPRVFLPGSDLERSSGWKWFRQIQPLRTSLSTRPSLPQLQLICLSVLYMSGSSFPEESWIMAGLGIRFAQGAGAHLRSGYKHMKPLDAELYKRVFWILLVTDTIASSFKGRPSMTRISDLDLDLPVDCEDEYWGIPAALQPPGNASISAWLAPFLKLMIILNHIQEAIYPANGRMCSQNVIMELDSELNNWVDSVPEHLRWDPRQENQILLDQSTALYAVYYHAQILLHRSFIPAPGTQSVSDTGFPSLAICANAARSCGHILDVQARRGRGVLHHPHVITALFDSAVVLLINVWALGDGKVRTPQDFNRATADAQNCVRVLRFYERRWRVAGRRCDIISAMLNMGKYKAGSPSPSLKRGRDSQDISPSSEVFLEPPEGRPVAGSSRASKAHQRRSLESSMQEPSPLFSLPLHTEELGRLPIYDSFDYAFTFQSNDIPYQPQSHLNLPYGGAGPIDPQLLYGLDASLIGSTFQQGGLGTVDGEQPGSFDILSGDDWGDWNTYLTGLNLNQGNFES